MPPTGQSRIVQIHPTRRCNLRCLHCYSMSSPEERDALAIALLREAVTDAAAEGYSIASISGGEPLLYQSLPELLEHAHACGMLTTVTTNGILLDDRRLEMLAGAADLVAVSLDGVPESHNRMRASPRAFEQMSARLEGLRRSQIPFGFIFTLTQNNLHELEWVATFALEQGASLLQIHPLEMAGRATTLLQGKRPDGIEATIAFLEAARIQEMAGERMFVQVDLVNRQGMQANPENLYAASLAVDEFSPLSELVTPLVIEPDGVVTPLEYGLSRTYALGSLHEAPLRELSLRWRREVLPSFRELCRRVYAEATEQSQAPFFNWYESIYQMSG